LPHGIADFRIGKRFNNNVVPAGLEHSGPELKAGFPRINQNRRTIAEHSEHSLQFPPSRIRKCALGVTTITIRDLTTTVAPFAKPRNVSNG
jgi:hypothetical protein